MVTNETISKLQDMRLGTMARLFREQLDDPSVKDLSFEDRFGTLVDTEWTMRKNNHLTRLIKNAGYAIPGACVEGIEYLPERKLDKAQILRLASCGCITSFFSAPLARERRIWPAPSAWLPAIANTIGVLDAEGAPDYLLTRYIAPTDPVGRWEQYNEAYRDINENDWLAEIVEELAPYAADAAVVEKSTYSSMDAPEVLAAMEGKQAVVLTGVVADCCILATMFDAIDLGYEVVYLYDCVAGVSDESEVGIRALAEIFSPIHTTLMSSDEYLAAINMG